MDRQSRAAFTELVEVSIAKPEGSLEIERAKSALLTDLERGRFNPARSEEVFRMAIDRAVWKHCGSVGAATTKAIRGEGIIEDAARKLSADFIRITGVRWSRSVGQFGGRVKLGPGCCQAASLSVLPTLYASSGVRPANVE